MTKRLLWLATIGLAACNLGTFDPSDGGIPPEDRTTCAASCHGSDGVAAPPRDTSGGTDPTSSGVGAHRAHLGTSSWHKRLECSTCHVVPSEIGAPGHIDTALPAELTFGGLGEGTTWNGTSCTTYCHGTGLSGGSTTAPAWTEGDTTPSDCGSCHGAPPPAPHPQDGDCATCHPTMNPGSMEIAYPELHVDGRLDVINAAACDSCHGSAGDPAPPADTTGATATSARGVGAHRQHLGASTWHKQHDCTECHRVPAGISDLGHVDTPLPAELVFGPLAGDATWNGTTCAGSYCHGATLAGGARTAPEWTRVDGTQVTCGSCHGFPPPPPHPSNNDCGTCHPTMAPGSGGQEILYPALHIDGAVDLIGGQACDACHGSGGNPAPPQDTTGGTSTSSRSVGAHRRHLDPSTWRKDIPCTACHLVPTATTAIGHMDTPAPAELTFGALAGNATWNGNTCANTYCHGATLTGGTSTNPVWTQVDGAQGQCGSCHGTPPPPPHPANPDCGTCHDTMTAGAGLVITDPARHIDGNLDVTGDQACDSCHGSGGVAAPPRDNAGNTATTARGVGAHRAHLAAGAWSAAIACDDCHRVPGAVSAVGHTDTPLPAELTFSARAGTATQWNGSRCSNNYCHGATLAAGGTTTAPIWNQVGSGQAACGACHVLPPPPPHPAQADCGTCHDTMTPGNPTTITAPARHIDGNLDVTTNQACDACHGSGGEAAPPTDTSGGNNTASRGVGAHRAHLGASTWHKEVTCATCHRVPSGVTSTGHTDTPLPAELTFTAVATGTIWSGTSCTSYCHGSTLAAGGTATAPVWARVDGSQATCGSCHGAPPPPPHPADPQCESCHAPVAGPNQTIAMAALHIDGTLQVTAVHPPGWAQPTMHGAAFNTQGPASCATASCHGVALTGGASNVSCNGCHSNWQTTCTFCHGGTDNVSGAPPESVTAVRSSVR